jgi:hypothetical protein
MPLECLRKFVFIHHNTVSVYIIWVHFFTVVYISESFCLHVIFEQAVEKYVHPNTETICLKWHDLDGFDLGIVSGRLNALYNLKIIFLQGTAFNN